MGGEEVSIIPKVNPEYALTIRDDDVVLTKLDTDDDYQMWEKIDWGHMFSDSEGHPAFALHNKGNGLLLMHPAARHQELRKTGRFDHTSEEIPPELLWTQSDDCGDYWRSLRQYNDTSLNVDAYQAQEGDDLEGNKVVVWEWAGGPNQLWKLI